MLLKIFTWHIAASPISQFVTHIFIREISLFPWDTAYYVFLVIVTFVIL